MGRRKTFERTDITEKAMRVFWANGFHAASISVLVDEMGINRSTLFTEFESKEGLYAAALQLYEERFVGAMTRRLTANDATIDAIVDFFTQFLEAAGQPGAERGCMYCNAAQELAPYDDDTRDAVEGYIEKLSRLFREALERSFRNGQLRLAVDVEGQARFLTTSLLGIFVLARARTDTEFVIDSLQTILSHVEGLRAS